MASPWITYIPHTPPPGPRDVQTSNLADNSHTVPSDRVVVSDASPVSIDSSERQALGQAGHIPSVSSVPPFNSTNGTHTEDTGKAAPIIVSATSFGFEFREAGLSTRTSVDKQPLQAPHSPVSDDGERYAPISEDADIAAANLIGSILPIHKHHVGPQLSLSSSTFERDVFASSPTKNTHTVAPISAADKVSPPPPPPSSPPDSTTIATGDVSITSSPNPGASQTPTVKLSLTQSPEHGRGKSEKQPPRRPGQGSTGKAGSVGSASIVQSQYTNMVFEQVPRTHNILSGLFTWILLAGFVVLPGTFSTLEAIQSTPNEFGKVLHKIHHLALLVIAFGCCVLGACGMLLLWWRWAHNYVWLLNGIFIPGVLNGLSGLISTFASVYGGPQSGVYNASSIATLAVTGACTVICGFLTAIYSLWKLDRVKRRHLREIEQMKSASGGDEIGEARQYF